MNMNTNMKYLSYAAVAVMFALLWDLAAVPRHHHVAVA